MQCCRNHQLAQHTRSMLAPTRTKGLVFRKCANRAPASQALHRCLNLRLWRCLSSQSAALIGDHSQELRLQRVATFETARFFFISSFLKPHARFVWTGQIQGSPRRSHASGVSLKEESVNCSHEHELAENVAVSPKRHAHLCTGASSSPGVFKPTSLACCDHHHHHHHLGCLAPHP